MAVENAKRIFAEQTGLSMQKGEEETLSTTIFVGIDQTNTGFRNALYYLINDVLT